MLGCVRGDHMITPCHDDLHSQAYVSQCPLHIKAFTDRRTTANIYQHCHAYGEQCSHNVHAHSIPCTSQALDEDQPGDRVEHRKVFEEDRDFNQGALVHPSCVLADISRRSPSKAAARSSFQRIFCSLHLMLLPQGTKRHIAAYSRLACTWLAFVIL